MTTFIGGQAVNSLLDEKPDKPPPDLLIAWYLNNRDLAMAAALTDWADRMALLRERIEAAAARNADPAYLEATDGHH